MMDLESFSLEEEKDDDDVLVLESKLGKLQLVIDYSDFDNVDDGFLIVDVFKINNDKDLEVNIEYYIKGKGRGVQEFKRGLV